MGRKKFYGVFGENDTPVGEELKITVALALKKLASNENQKELEFPSSFTGSERKYIHLISLQLGFKSKSRGKGSMRFLTVYKKEGSTIMSKEPILQLVESSRFTILNLLQRSPVTNKERQDLLPGTEKDRLMNPELRDLNLVRSLGRLTPGPHLVPPLPGHSDVTVEARKLPIWNAKDQLLSAIDKNQVILVCGETGSGKTTQVPQAILQQASTLSRPCRIFCTQPRRISAMSIAERVAIERGEKVGYTVGYQIRLEGKLSPKTLLTFCTTGVLLRTLMGGESTLSSVTHVIVDEVHERDRFSDFLLTVLRDCLPKFHHLKLILMSANLDVNLYAKYFSNCPVIEIIVDEVHERDRFSDFLLTVLRDCLPKFHHLKLILMSANLDVNLYAKYFSNCPVIEISGRAYNVKPFYLEDVLKFTNYKTPKMQTALKQLQNIEKAKNETTEWTRNILKNLNLSSSVSESQPKELLGKEKCVETQKKKDNLNSNNDSNTIPNQEEMDRCIEKAFTLGDDEYFNQMIYLIMSENVSPDYQHSSTWASPLMVAAGRGRLDILEQLFSLGASVNLKSANEWTAADWAKSTNEQEAFDFLQSYSACEGIDLKTSQTDISSVHTSFADKELLDAYNLSLTYKNTDTDLIFALCLKIHQDQPPGGLLIFLPGYEEIVTLREQIMNEDKQFNQAGKYCLYCLHSSMQSTDQKKVFRSSPPGVRKIVLSTNIAETSITINDIVYVIDCGKLKEVSYDAISGISCLRAVWISQASATQRRGRAGRCQPGICYHLFSKSFYNLLQPHQTPEILRSPLQDLCLQTKLLASPNMLIADFLAKAPEPPAFMCVKNAVQLLKSMDALDPWEDVTELGHHLLDLPLPPHLGKMVIISTILKCLDPVLTIAVCLAYRDPFILPSHPSDKIQVRNVRKKFSLGTFSDHMVFLKAFQAWQKACTEQRHRKWCERNYVSGATMEMIHGMRAQVLAQLRSSGFVRARGPADIRDVNSNSDNWAVVKAALLSGTYPNLIRVDREQKQLRTEKESKVRLHSSSVILDVREELNKDSKIKYVTNQAHKNLVGSLPCDWLLFDEMVRIGVVSQVKTVTLVSPLSVLLMAGPMRLPLDALSEPSHSGLGLEDESSDSESEERPEGINCTVKIDTWIQFLGDHLTSSLSLQLRHKLHALILRRLRAPNKPLTQGDEDTVRVVAAILNQEDLNLGLPQPPGVGQRPRPFHLTQGQDMNATSFNEPEDILLQQLPTHKGSEAVPCSVSQTHILSNILTPSASRAITAATTNCITGTSQSSLSGSISTAVSLKGITTTEDNDSNTKKPFTIACKKDNGSSAASSQVNNMEINSNSKFANTCASSTQMKHNFVLGTEGGKSRYFIIRVGAYRQIEIGQTRNLWSFQYSTERKIVQAAQNSIVTLIFALNRGNQFYGYAKFKAQKSDEKCPEMASFGPPNCSLYKIEWTKKWFIYFHQTRHLLNPLTDNLQVHMCRDGQEVEPFIGEQLIKVWDRPQANAGNNNIGGGGRYLPVNEPIPPVPRHPFHPHGPLHPHMGPPPMHHPQHGPPFRPFRGFGAANGWFGANNFRGDFRGGFRR